MAAPTGTPSDGLQPPNQAGGPRAADAAAEAQERGARAISAYFNELFDEPLASTATTEALAQFAAVPGGFAGDATGAEERLLQIARAAAGGKLLALPTPAPSVPVTAAVGHENVWSRPTGVSPATVAIAGAALAVAMVRRRRRIE